MTALFEALLDTTMWSPSSRPSREDGDNVVALAHRSGLEIEACRGTTEWLLFLILSPDGSERDYVLALQRNPDVPDNILADLDRAFGPGGQRQFQYLCARIWHWLLHAHTVALHQDVVLMREARAISLLGTHTVLALPDALDPIVRATRGVVGAYPKRGDTHGLNMSRHLMPGCVSMHDRLLRMQPPVPPILA